MTQQEDDLQRLRDMERLIFVENDIRRMEQEISELSNKIRFRFYEKEELELRLNLGDKSNDIERVNK